jgi:hypothetical protein
VLFTQPGPSLYPYSPECVEGVFSEVRRHGVLTAGFSERDPHRMMRMRDFDEELVRMAEVASICGQVSIDATRCKKIAGRVSETVHVGMRRSLQ